MPEDYTGLVYYLCLPALCLWIFVLAVLVVVWSKLTGGNDGTE